MGLGLGDAKVGPGPCPLLKQQTHVFSSFQIYNLGTGTGYSVLQMVQAMERASGREVRSDLRLQGHGHKPSVPRQPLAPLPQLLGLGSIPSTEPLGAARAADQVQDHGPARGGRGLLLR